MEQLIERLFIYHSILDAYKRALKFDSHQKQTEFLDCGFCLHISEYYNILTYSTMIFREELPELYEQKPTQCFDNIGHWFGEGDIKPRIKCLKDAIKLTEEKICLLKK